MMYTLIKLLLARPGLLAQHVANYADVLRHEVQTSARLWIMKAVAAVACAVCLLVALIMAGVALMLGILQNQFQWVLVIVPLVPLALGLIALGFALRKPDHTPLAVLRQQFAADMALFTGKENTSQPSAKTGLQTTPPAV